LKKKDHEVSQLNTELRDVKKEIRQKNIDIQNKDRLLQYANDGNTDLYVEGNKLQDENRLLKRSLRESQKVKAEDEARLLQSNGENDTLREKIESLEATISKLRRNKKRAGRTASMLEGLGE
jgi:hypothetical protein